MISRIDARMVATGSINAERATPSAARVADTWACPTKRGKPVFEELSLKEAKALLEESASQRFIRR
jgi:hypothetical protein